MYDSCIPYTGYIMVRKEMYRIFVISLFSFTVVIRVSYKGKLRTKNKKIRSKQSKAGNSRRQRSVIKCNEEEV